MARSMRVMPLVRDSKLTPFSSAAAFSPESFSVAIPKRSLILAMDTMLSMLPLMKLLKASTLSVMPTAPANARAAPLT